MGRYDFNVGLRSAKPHVIRTFRRSPDFEKLPSNRQIRPVVGLDVPARYA
jgi:hypothetical protein